jgi:hypothetical protein
VREQAQAQEEPQWFAFRTDVSLGWRSAIQTQLAWYVLLLDACCGCAAVYGALTWLVRLDAAPVVRGLGGVSRMLGLIPT